LGFGFGVADTVAKTANTITLVVILAGVIAAFAGIY
jgi:hypothetical protein